MIISASRRTDIPTYYSEWFMNRIREEYVVVQNPIYQNMLYKKSLAPNDVDCIVFWTKNSKPIFKYIDEISEKYKFYFQYTITPYGKDVEINIPDKYKNIIPEFQKLSDKIGSEKVIWRYDPIILSNTYNLNFHKESFEKMCSELKGYTNKCVISFVDLYKNTKSNTKCLNLLPISNNDMEEIAKWFSDIADKNNITIETCCEDIDFEKYNIHHGHCIDIDLIEKITGETLKIKKDKNQRLSCGCAASIDIGVYNTCKNGCKYCYANYNDNVVYNRYYDVKSPLLCGKVNISELENITNDKK